MKKVFGLVALGMFLTNPSYADLTKQDIEEIRKIIKEEIQQVDKRIDELKIELKAEIKEVRTEIKEVRAEIKDVRAEIRDVRGEIMENMKWGFGVLLTGIFILMGFILWDRRTALAPAVKRTKEIEEREERIEKALKEYAIKEPKLGIILREVGILQKA
ncbi:MAG: hypothetical protein AB1414_11970 [bacterium]